MNFTSIWKQTKKEIKKKIPDHAYSTWVDPIKLVGFNDNILRLEVPNQFFFNWIQSTTTTISLCQHFQIFVT